MKQFFLFVCGAVTLASCNSNTAVTKSDAATAAAMNTDLIQQNLQGKVKTIVEANTNIDSMGKEKADSVTNTSNFDERGYLNSVQTKDQGGKITADQAIKHDSAGPFMEYVSNKNGKMSTKLVTELDKDGNYNGGKSYDSTGKQDSYYKDLKQNEYGIVYAGKRYGMNDKIKEEFDMKYDKTHFLGGKSKDSTGKVTYDGTAKVNDKGDMSEEDYTYVENGKTKSEKNTYKYDKYDDKGNWIQRTKYNDKGKPTQVTKRILTYYN